MVVYYNDFLNRILFLGVVNSDFGSTPSLSADEEIPLEEDPHLEALVSQTPDLDEEEGVYFAKAVLGHMNLTGISFNFLDLWARIIKSFSSCILLVHTYFQ